MGYPWSAELAHAVATAGGFGMVGLGMCVVLRFTSFTAYDSSQRLILMNKFAHRSRVFVNASLFPLTHRFPLVLA